MMTACGDGRFMGRRYFFCQDEHGYFCRVSDIQPLEPTTHGDPALALNSAASTNCEYGM